ncbi:UbiA prenyltransferase family-domain-containing protein [Mycena epipterygia]|nr:UbiA prenyltransferase family-domain-containing protein [Mycena epipterygia]
MGALCTAIIARISRELDLFFAFSWRDWSATIIAGSIWGIGAVLSGPVSAPALLYRFPRLVVWLSLYMYSFNLCNQLIGVDEDRLNKPDRPIPSGKVTPAGARRRAIVVVVAFLAIGMISPRVIVETICWVITTSWVCWTSAGHHWLGKNGVVISIGAWALLSGAWKCLASYTPETQRYILALALWASIMTNIQDIRDVAGDRAIGRKTMPIVYGDIVARRLITFLGIPLGLLMLWLGSVLATAPATITLVHILLGYRVMNASEGPRYDHKTYMMQTYIFCFMLTVLAISGSRPDVLQGF